MPGIARGICDGCEERGEKVASPLLLSGLDQKAAIYLSHRYSGARLKELGAYFGKKESAISQASLRFAAAMENDGKLAKVIVSLVEKLKLS